MRIRNLPLVIAANRDEFHARPAKTAHWWPDGTLAGVDLEAGGTWFGVTRRGRWALVTNFREGIPRDPNAPSRGGLVTRALADHAAPLVAAAAIAADGVRYHGYNLLVGECSQRGLHLESCQRRAGARQRYSRVVESSARNAVAEARARQGASGCVPCARLGRHRVAVRTTGRSHPGRARDTAVDRHRARMGAVAVERVHRRCAVRDALLDRADDRTRRCRALRRTQFRPDGPPSPGRSHIRFRSPRRNTTDAGRAHFRSPCRSRPQSDSERVVGGRKFG